MRPCVSNTHNRMISYCFLLFTWCLQLFCCSTWATDSCLHLCILSVPCKFQCMQILMHAFFSLTQVFGLGMCGIMSCYNIMRYAILSYIILYCSILHYMLQHVTIWLYCILLYSAIVCHVILYYSIEFCILLCYSILYCIRFCYIVT